MYKEQIFREVLSAVVEASEVPEGKILSRCKEEEVVDARALLIKLMSEKGLYPTQISRLTGLNIRCVTQFLLDFGERVESRKLLRIDYDRLRSHLGVT